jgi:hypothetical protein
MIRVERDLLGDLDASLRRGSRAVGTSTIAFCRLELVGEFG